MSQYNNRFLLVGPLEGKTINLGGHQFVEGVYTFDGTGAALPSAEEIKMKGDYLAKSYQAFLEGSPELAAARERLSEGKGPANELKVDDRERAEPHQGDHHVPDVVVKTEVILQDKPVETAESVAAQTTNDRQTKTAIRNAVVKLDPTNDDHWTDGGLPAVAAVRDLAGNQDVSRADIAALAPKLTREEAAKLAADPLD